MQRTPFYDEHLKLGGKIVDFNGWALPIQFAGILKEHAHTRTKASLFDCSHMGKYRIIGAQAIGLFDSEIFSDVSTIPVGRCRYGAILTESGGIMDDLISFRMSEDELYVVTNAGPVESVTRRICEGNPGAEHVSFSMAKIDVQGPTARDRVLAAGFEAAESLKYFNALWTQWRGKRVLLSRTGYTGELGYELFLDNEHAAELWNVFVQMEGLEPAGLGARDTLRTEIGYGLSGQDFDDTVTPLEAGMDPFIAWDTDFVGKPALEAMRDSGDHRVLVGITTATRQAPRRGFEIRSGDAVVGEVTSGTFAPTLRHGVGLARVDKGVSPLGTKLTAGPRNIEIETTGIPFYKGGTCRAKI